MIGKAKNSALLVALVCLVPLGANALEGDLYNNLDFQTQDEVLEGFLEPGNPRLYRRSIETETDFGYGPSNGPSTWPEKFRTCAGRRQSPINIRLNRLDSLSSEEPRRLRFNNYDELPLEMFLTNVGKTVTLTANYSANDHPSISGFLFRDEYKFAEIHFHWGKTLKEGSEHLVDGRSYPLEMHVVHFKEAYGNITEAKKKRDGLAVIGYFFEVRHDRNQRLQRLINKFDQIIDPSSAPVPIRPFRLEELAPPFRRKFISYSGSLTTPLCDQVVRWIVNLRPLKLSKAQLPPFRKLKDNKGKFLVRNFRPPQPLNRRRVLLVH